MILVDGLVDVPIPADDRGLLYGDGVFRTMLAVDGVVRHWAGQYACLCRDCRRLDLPTPPRSALEDDLRQLPGKGRLAVRVTITRGSGPRGYAVPSPVHARRIVQACPAPPPPGPVRLVVAGLRLGRQPALAGVKHLGRQEQVLARMEPAPADAWERLLLDDEDRPVSGTMTNLAFWDGEALHTPLLDRCGVAGHTRQRLFDAARGLGLALREGRPGLAELLAAREVMLMNSLAGLVPVARLADRSWSSWPLSARLATWMEDMAC